MILVVMLSMESSGRSTLSSPIRREKRMGFKTCLFSST